MRATAKIFNGQLAFNPKYLKAVNKFYNENESKEILVQMKSAEESRSDAQNRFWHSCILPATMRSLQLQGHKKSWDKDWVKEGFLKKTFLMVDAGTQYEYVRHSSDLGVKEFWLFTCKCLQLLETIGGDLNLEEQEEYERIVQKYKLSKHISDAMAMEL